MFAAPTLIDRSEMEIELNPRLRPNTETNGHQSPRSETNIYHMPPSRPPSFFITHYL
jgi:hypothetical protein